MLELHRQSLQGKWIAFRGCTQLGIGTCPKRKVREDFVPIRGPEYEASEAERRYYRIRISRTKHDTVKRLAPYQPESCDVNPAHEVLDAGHVV